jgi:hypothetical protein
LVKSSINGERNDEGTIQSEHFISQWTRTVMKDHNDRPGGDQSVVIEKDSERQR